jgi:DNA-binding PucR family transcriptional regulator
MHVSRASKRLHVHENTLRYRLGRFEEASGVSLRDSATAFEVWWALEHRAVAERGEQPHAPSESTSSSPS